jgi:hypothetical protein
MKKILSSFVAVAFLSAPAFADDKAAAKPAAPAAAKEAK